MKQLLTIIIKDLRVFFSDKGAVAVTLLVPIGIATFLTLVNGGAADTSKPKPVPILVGDADQSTGSKEIVRRLQADTRAAVTIEAPDKVQAEVKEGKFGVGLVIPKGFFEAARASMLTNSNKPEIQLFQDPSQRINAMASRGLIMGDAIGAILDNGTTNSAAKEDEHMPFTVKDLVQAGKVDDAVATKSHIFSGLAIQGVLFFAINIAMGVIRERNTGFWKRLRTTSVTPGTLAMGRFLSGSIIGVFVLLAVFLFGSVVFKLNLLVNPVGFGVVTIMSALLASSLGLLIASIGKTEEQSRGASIMVVLCLTMLGGAWFPTFMMPEALQKATLLVPTRWAVDGYDGALWRGLEMAQLLPIVGVLALFITGFMVLATKRIAALDRAV